MRLAKDQDPAAVASSENQLTVRAHRLSLEAERQHGSTPHRLQPSSSPPPPRHTPIDCDGEGAPCGLTSPASHHDVAAEAVVAARRRWPQMDADAVDDQLLTSTGIWPSPSADRGAPALDHLPNEILFHIFDFLDVSDVLAASRTSHHLRSICIAPFLHIHRLRRARELLPPLLWNPQRPSLAELISRSIFLTNTSVVSRRLARSLVSIRLSRRLAARPSPEALAERAVLPKECVPGMAPVQVAPSIVQRSKAVERERIKDDLRRWVEGKWRRKVREREELQRRWEESRGVGRVWRLRKFWERIGRGEDLVVR